MDYNQASRDRKYVRFLLALKRECTNNDKLERMKIVVDQANTRLYEKISKKHNDEIAESMKEIFEFL